jgi:orotate phosphoribosyltransferase
MIIKFTPKAELIALIKERGTVDRGRDIVLSDGSATRTYLDIKNVLDTGERLNLAAKALMAHMLDTLGSGEVARCTAIGGPTMGADVLAHVVVSLLDDDAAWFAIRDRVKTDHGMGKWIEGAELTSSDHVIITDDVANAGKSLVDAVEKVRATGATVAAVMPLVDRAGVARSKIEALGIPYLPLVTHEDLGLPALGDGSRLQLEVDTGAGATRLG